MGQYYLLVNTDKNEYLHPHKLGLGLKELEMTHGIMGKILIYLITYSSRGGGGDIHNETPSSFHGSWYNNHIWNTGDYDNSLLYNSNPEEPINTYDRASNDGTDITYEVVVEMIQNDPTIFFPREYNILQSIISSDPLPTNYKYLLETAKSESQNFWG